MNFAIVVFSLVFLFVSNCTYPIKEQEALENDREFLSFADPKLEAKNQSALKDMRNSRLEEAEKQFLQISEEDKGIVSYLNLLRFYYLLDGYEEAKEALLKIQAQKSWNREKLEEILSTLKEKNRDDERAIVLDAISRIRGMELYAWQELGTFFLYKGNLSQAEDFFERILAVQPFHENALVAMSEIRHDQADYKGLYDYAKSLQIASGKKTTGAYYFLAKACMELGKHKEALQWIGQATEKEKKDPAFLMVWRDSLLALDPYASLESIRPFYKKATQDGFSVSEDIFLPSIRPEGRELVRSVFQGR